MPAPGLNPHRARVTGTPYRPRLRALALLRRRPEPAASTSLADVRETCTQADIRRASVYGTRSAFGHVRKERHRVGAEAIGFSNRSS